MKLLKRGPKTLPVLYRHLRINDEIVKQEVRKLRAAGLLHTEWVKGEGRGRTLLCKTSAGEFNGS